MPLPTFRITRIPLLNCTYLEPLFLYSVPDLVTLVVKLPYCRPPCCCQLSKHHLHFELQKTQPLCQLGDYMINASLYFRCLEWQPTVN
jgi:hypothetical protein